MEYDWKRYWVRQGAEASMESGYFFSPSDASTMFSPTSNGVLLEELQAEPFLVLLGSVGIGKTTAVKKEWRRLSFEDSQTRKTKYFDLKNRSDATIRSLLLGDSAVSEWRSDKCSVTIFLDSIDEARRTQVDLKGWLEELLEPLSLNESRKHGLYLRLICRSSDWVAELSSHLSELFGVNNEVQEVEDKTVLNTYYLAPLRKLDVSTAFESHGVDFSRLEKKLQERRLESLAGHPLTLNMLQSVFAQANDIPNTRAELFEQACRILCKSQSTGSLRRSSNDNPELILSAARAVAFVSAFSGWRSIVARAGSVFLDDSLVDVEEVVGMQCDDDGNVVAWDVAVRLPFTGLFSGVSPGRVEWFHRSIAEYLAASYVVTRRIPSSSLRNLLAYGEDRERVVPQLGEVFIWICNLDPKYGDTFRKANADLILRSEFTDLNPGGRVELFDAYISGIRSSKFSILEWSERHFYRGFSSSALELRLSESITDSNELLLVREVSIQIAAQIGCSRIAADLVGVFYNSHEVSRLRKEAGYSLLTLVGQHVGRILVAKGPVDSEFDPDDDLYALWLDMVWPKYIDSCEILPLRKPKNTNYLGHYAWTMMRKFAEGIQETDIPLFLNWIIDEKIGFGWTGDFGALPGAVVARAVNHLDNPEIRECLVALIEEDFLDLQEVFKIRAGIRGPDSSSRLNLWSLLVDSAVDIRVAAARIRPGRSWGVTDGDVVLFAEQYVGEQGDKRKAKWEELVSSFLNASNHSVFADLCDLAKSYPELESLIATRTSCQILPDQENLAKKLYFEAKLEREHSAIHKKPLSRVIEELMEHFEKGEIYAFCKIADHLLMDPENYPAGAFYITQVSTGKVWEATSIGCRERILSAAQAYLEKAEFDEEVIWQREILHPPAFGFLVAAGLLFDCGKSRFDSIAECIWERWAPAFTSYSTRFNVLGDKAAKALSRILSEQCLEAYLVLLNRKLENGINCDSTRSIFWMLQPAWNEQFNELVCSLLDRKDLKDSAIRDLYQLLINTDRDRNLPFLREIAFSEYHESWKLVRKAVAIAVLVWNSPEDDGGGCVHEITTDRRVGCAAVPILVARSEHPDGWLLRLKPGVLGMLWEWMEKEYPGDPYDDEDSNWSIEHDIYHFRGAIFSQLTRSSDPSSRDTLLDLANRHPDRPYIAEAAASLRESQLQQNWLPSHPKQIMALVRSKDNRLVRTTSDLSKPLCESILRYEKSLHSSPPVLELWNESARTVKRGRKNYSEPRFQPKNERNISNCLKRFLENDLAERAIVADREVEIKPNLGSSTSELIDIFVTACPYEVSGRSGDPVQVVIEVKGAWNKKVEVEMKTQLFDRYLSGTDLDTGIFAVFYFRCDAWVWDFDGRIDLRGTSGGHRKKLENLRSFLEAQADQLTEPSRKLRALVVDARIGV